MGGSITRGRVADKLAFTSLHHLARFSWSQPRVPLLAVHCLSYAPFFSGWFSRSDITAGFSLPGCAEATNPPRRDSAPFLDCRVGDGHGGGMWSWAACGLWCVVLCELWCVVCGVWFVTVVCGVWFVICSCCCDLRSVIGGVNGLCKSNPIRN